MLGFPGAPADVHSMRLAPDDSQVVTPAQRSSRKRKSPPDDQQPTPPNPTPAPAPAPAPPPQIHHVLPPMIHPMAAHPPLPPGYHYDFSPGGMPPPPPQQQDQQSGSPAPNSAAGRALSSSKRAEQNRKAQRAFRERRDQHVKALESRSQLLDAALSSADEANRRWEECRVLLDQLRVENAALRAALSQSQIIPQLPPNPAAQPSQNSQQEKTDQQQLEEATRSLEAVVHNELKGAEAQHQQQNTD